MVPTRVAGRSAIPRRSGAGLHIGVHSYALFRKNIHNQVAAALLSDGATVHVAGERKLFHLSFSELWGQVAAESLAVGVPCMIANHSDIYD